MVFWGVFWGVFVLFWVFFSFYFSARYREIFLGFIFRAQPRKTGNSRSAHHYGRLGFPGADGRLPIRPRCGQVTGLKKKKKFIIIGVRGFFATITNLAIPPTNTKHTPTTSARFNTGGRVTGRSDAHTASARSPSEPQCRCARVSSKPANHPLDCASHLADQTVTSRHRPAPTPSVSELRSKPATRIKCPQQQ